MAPKDPRFSPYWFGTDFPKVVSPQKSDIKTSFWNGFESIFMDYISYVNNKLVLQSPSVMLGSDTKKAKKLVTVIMIMIIIYL